MLHVCFVCTSEIRAQHLFEKETSELNFPQYQDDSFSSNFKLGLYTYLSLLQSKSMLYPSLSAEIIPLTQIHKPRLTVDSTLRACCRRNIVRHVYYYFSSRSSDRLICTFQRTMFFQQWTGVNAILYYAPSIFDALGLSGSTNELLATGVVGIVYAKQLQHLRSVPLV